MGDELSGRREQEKPPLTDGFGRRISYLRVSVTDRCNLRCWYCMPGQASWMPKNDVLSYEELQRVISAAAGIGISKIRLTGGEPLLRSGLCSFVRRVVETPGVREVTLTTNGVLLPRYATELKASGLERVNISIDTMDARQYEIITRGGCLGDVIAGIDAAIAAGFQRVKLNAVLRRDADMDDIRSLVEFSKSKGAVMRFIELMPLLRSESRITECWDSNFVSAQEMKARLTGINLDHVEFISPVSEPFCDTCNRLRLTPDGMLLACLCRGGHVNAREILRSGGGDEELAQALERCASLKPEPWRAWGETTRLERISAIGG
ncbi:MAG: GTP 3',8-cyclase MoaA [Armatimonadota bacterium]|nr:GTP 3',8-cyclase MoaA [Armatimonadota bacterium]